MEVEIGHVPTYVAVPAGSEPWPGVVVLHDFPGMSHGLRRQADRLAGAGCLAAADMTRLLVLLGKVSRTAYHEPYARERIVAFFDQHLRPHS
ncbi:dienelactone hydrolase family protein [Nonomuraea basaltis]|uniref:dienelactone hydrolase family protein n=1 Tax=Nonomuraea basaltis TaxID=2495887 RepID=UPI0019825204|nr:dienelactone hydrolase family protein [Nonomuraea basaltis]